ncbi:DUF1624 domain-containing protein [Rhabdaerophilum calidifontis]|uniref:DUF1624 domain-containing protein n=1 Tax=Rhabdaerophilum calidifontis TaxID=2604328 RepID=UPI00123941A5|nr:heparan-alpha-glucosaminide N-acetyltransferase [Rhabdaerophilum calidifontis]
MGDDAVGPRDVAGHTHATRRMAALDIARGMAIVAMIVYHTAWNLSFLGLSAVDIRDSTLWTGFARAIAASFLALTGIGLVLAHRRGFDAPAFGRRLARIAGGALLVTAGTYLVFPGSFVFFGILHAIAVFSLLALPALRLPVAIVIALALAIFALPWLWRSEAFSSPWLVWLGLGTREPVTNDFVPLFPWFGMVLAGIAFARLAGLGDIPAATAAPVSRPGKALAWAGRRSLAIYLLHQPILFGALWLLALAIQPAPDPEARGFLSACRAECRATGGEVLSCQALCRCAVEGLKAEGLWAQALAGQLDTAGRLRLDAISHACAADSAAR